MWKKIFIVHFILLLSACSTYTLVDSKKPINIRGMTLTTDINWTQLPPSDVASSVASIWTLDGVLLNQLHIFGPVDAGKTLYNARSKELVMAEFKADMLPNEVAELLADSIKNIYGGTITVDVQKLRPQAFGDVKGFSFEANFFNGDGLYTRGKAFATIQNEKLYMIFYLAPDIHYFDRYIAHVDYLVKNASVNN